MLPKTAKDTKDSQSRLDFFLMSFSFHYGQGAVSWSFKKQSIIALLSTEAEYIAETHAAKEAIWLWMFINEVVGGEKGPVTVNADNQVLELYAQLDLNIESQLL